MFTAPNHRASPRNHAAPNAPDAQAVRKALAVLSRAMQPVPAPVAPQPASQIIADNNARDLAAWARVERCTVYLVDPNVCPVSLPLQSQHGYTPLLSGKPSKRFVAMGFNSGIGKPVEARVVPHYQTGEPTVVYAHGSAAQNFKIVG